MKQRIYSLIVLSGSIISCLFMLEFFIADYFIDRTSDIYFHKFDPVLGWKPESGSYEFKPQNSMKKHTIYINKFGLRNREIGMLKKKHTTRIIVLGDSFTFGMRVDNKDLFTTRLEKILNEEVEGDTHTEYEVINAGVPAYGTGQELLIMRYLAEQGIVGDIYLLMMFNNDIFDNMRLLRNNLAVYAPSFVLDENGSTPILKHLPKKVEVNGNNNTTKESDGDDIVSKMIEAISNLKTVRFLEDRLGTLLQTRPAIVNILMKLGIKIESPEMPATIIGWYHNDIFHKGLPLLKALVSEIKQEAINKKAKLMVALIPSPIDIYPDIYRPILQRAFPGEKMVAEWLNDPERPQRITVELCNALEIPMLDLYAVLYKNNKRNFYIYRDGHFNEAGHAIVAESIVKFIQQSR